MAPGLKKLSIALCAFFPLLVLALIAFYEPFWGLMDDAVNLDIARGMRESGFWTVFWSEAKADLFGNGRLRFLYPVMVWFLYGPASGNSLITYTLNALFVSGIFLFLGYAYSYSGNMISRVKGRWAFCAVFFLFCFAYPWTQHLFISPSVQEKLVILFSGVLVWLLYWNKNAVNDFLWALPIFFALALAVNTKEQIVLFFPLLLAIQLQAGRVDMRWKRVALLFALLVAATFSIWWAGTFGHYKQRYGLDSALATVRASKSMWLFLGLGLLSQIASLRVWKKDRDLFSFFHRSGYSLGLILFVVIMLPWGMGHYLNTAALVFVFFCCFNLVNFFFPEWLLGKASFLVVAAAGLAITLSLLGPSLSAAGDLEHLLRSEGISAVAASGQKIHIPCEEGATRIRQYAKLFYSLDLDVEVALEAGADQVENTGGVWLISPLRCTNGVDFRSMVENGRATNLFRGRYSSGFHLLELKAAK